jgi:Zn-dependent peptidase ImmA (M78 family)
MTDTNQPKKPSLKALFGGTYKEIEELAAKLRGNVDSHFDESEPLRERLDWLVEFFGGSVKICESFSDPSLTIYNEDRFEITLATGHSLTQDNWTIAREIGHYILHYNREYHEETDPPILFWRREREHMEWQSNRFAAAFTMPAEEFRKLWVEKPGNLYYLASHFEVPDDVVKIRSEYILKDENGESEKPKA